MRDFENRFVKMTNRYVASNPPREDIAICAIDWMNKWAEKKALIGEVNKSGESVRKWTLGTRSQRIFTN